MPSPPRMSWPWPPTVTASFRYPIPFSAPKNAWRRRRVIVGSASNGSFYSGVKEGGLVIINSDQELLSADDIERLRDLNVKVFYIAGTELAIEVAGTELSTNMSMIGSVAGITKCVSMESLDGALQERFGKKFVASGGTASLDEAIKKKFAKKEMLLAKNLATMQAAYNIASEWAEKNKYELRVGNPAVAA